MSKFLVLYNYNKYYNRIIKKLSTYAEYKALITPLGSTPAQLNGLEVTGSNFDWEDGVFAKHVINIPRGSSSFFNYNEPDYLVLERTYKDGDTDVTEISRWFVLETTKTRGNQFELSLRRDLLADYFSEVLNAPVFIEKGNPGIDDPAIFNRESMTFNQIKTNELKLDFDKHSGKGGGWIVGYLAKEENPSAIGPCVGQAKIPLVVYDFGDFPAELRTLLTGDQNGWKIKPGEFSIKFKYNTDKPYNGTVDCELKSNYSLDDNLPMVPASNSPVYFRGNSWDQQLIRNYIISEFRSSSVLSWGTKVDTWFSTTGWTGLFTGDYSSYNGCIFKKDGKYYKLTITNQGPVNQTVTYTRAQVDSQANDLCSIFKQFINSYLINGDTVIGMSQNANANAVTFVKPVYNYTFVTEEIDFDEVSVTIPADRNTNLEAPYDLFCIPIGEVSVKSSGLTVLTNALNVALATAQAIAVKGGQKVYDIQILPYCPFDEILNSDGDIDITGFDNDEDYTYITKTIGGVTSNVGIVIFPKSCRGTFDLEIPNTVDVYSDCIEEVESVVDKKIKSETKLVRFVSPNFASTFDINVQKNKGITRLNVDYFYKPYQPYLHVAPYFSGLYGEDFNDPKGLICSGEFSISTAQSQWENYQIQNKNYELIFNRQIQNLDVNNSIAMEQARITAGLGQASSLLTGVAGGAVAGSLVGGPIGTAVGAVVGGVASAVTSGVGAKYDLEYLKRSQTEARSFASDMYAYSLGNIQALPYSLTRVSTLTENNKIFPFIEFYDCTEEEREALRNKIKYNGMTIMRIGKIVDFITAYNKYVQGQLIRLEGIDEDSHVVAEIANEIKEGAYYYGSDSIES